jgi:WD40 repeat protein
MRLWDVGTGQLLHSFEEHPESKTKNTVLSVAFSRDGTSALAGTTEGTLQLWDIDRGALRRTFRPENAFAITSVALSADGSFALSGSDDQTVKVWDVNTGQLVRTLRGHTAYVNSVAFSPDANWPCPAAATKQ